MSEPNIAVLIPCYNEQATVGTVVEAFRAELPDARVYVFDNASTDATARRAEQAGATVIREPRRGKGNVIETMFDAIDADIYVMVDGDDTYPPDSVHALIEPLRHRRADMTVGARLSEYEDTSFRPLHVAGNSLVRRLINRIFHTNLTDILSGYRAFNRRVVDRVPIVSSGFEVETELTIHMLYYRLAVVEVQVPYRARPAGSSSKLRTFHDGARVLWKLFSLIRAYKPLTFFGAMAILAFLLGLLAGATPINDWITTGEVPHVGLSIIAASLVTLSIMLFLVGLILHAMNWRFKELHNVLCRRAHRER